MAILGGMIASYGFSFYIDHTKNVQFGEGFLGAGFIYLYLLPLIVIGEGFTLGNSIWTFLASKWRLFLIPLIVCFGVELTA